MAKLINTTLLAVAVLADGAQLFGPVEPHAFFKELDDSSGNRLDGNKCPEALEKYQELVQGLEAYESNFQGPNLLQEKYKEHKELQGLRASGKSDDDNYKKSLKLKVYQELLKEGKGINKNCPVRTELLSSSSSCQCTGGMFRRLKYFSRESQTYPYPQFQVCTCNDNIVLVCPGRPLCVKGTCSCQFIFDFEQAEKCGKHQAKYDEVQHNLETAQCNDDDTNGSFDDSLFFEGEIELQNFFMAKGSKESSSDSSESDDGSKESSSDSSESDDGSKEDRECEKLRNIAQVRLQQLKSDQCPVVQQMVID